MQSMIYYNPPPSFFQFHANSRSNGIIRVLPATSSKISPVKTATCLLRAIKSSSSSPVEEAKQADSESEFPDSPFTDFMVQECDFERSELVPFHKRLQPFLRCKATATATAIEAAKLLRREFGFSPQQIRTILLRNPNTFRLRAETQLRPKLQLIQSLGFDPDEFRIIVTSSPRFLCYNLEKKLKPHVETLLQAFGGKIHLCKAVSKTRQLLYSQRCLQSNLSLLAEWGFEGGKLQYLVRKGPFLLAISTDCLQTKLDFVRELGFKQSSSLFVHALVVVGRIKEENYERRLRNLSSLGLEPDQVKEIFRKCPYVVTASLEKMRRNMRFVQSLGYDVHVVVRCPALLSYSLERNIRPRHAVIKCLSMMYPDKRIPSIVTVSSISEKTFLDRYILSSPYAKDLMGIYKQATEDAVAGAQ